MFRLILFAAVGLALLAPAARAKTIVVTEAQNGRAVTLVAGDILVVRLTSRNGLRGAIWSVLYNPEGLLRLSSDPHYLYPVHPHDGVVVGMGDSIPQEFHFTVPQSRESFTKGAWLLFMYQSAFEPSVKNAKVWKIQYTIKATK